MEAIAEQPVVVAPKPSPSLVRKLATVMGAVERVAKNGKNAFLHYSYATEGDIIQAVRQEMAIQGIMLVPTVDKVEWTPVETSQGKKERLCTLHVIFTVLDSDSDSSLRFTIIGQGQDSGDKASYKAMTGATKYALLKLFLIPTGDDPEDEKAPDSMPHPAGVEALRKSVATPKPSRLTIRDEPPPHGDDDAERFAGLEEASGPVRTHEDMSFPFGKNKGVKLSAMDAGSLDFYESAFTNNLADMSKAQWHAKTSLQLAAVQAEKRFRGL